MTDLFSKANALLLVTFLLAGYLIFLGVVFIDGVKAGIPIIWQIAQGGIFVAFSILVAMYFYLYLLEKK